MAEEERESSMQPEFPTGRVKKIMKLDPEIQRVSSEALFLVSCSTELFLRFMAEKSAQVAVEKKRKIVKLEHLRIAVKRHQPTSDFLLDSLPLPSLPVDRPTKDRSQSKDADKPPPPGARRIDHFFRKPEDEASEPRDEP
ncbi:DNA polymerase II subunit B3-1 [Prosopis cineraria]|uniref:DNA polymerase II subunit B3-1 n=1 Tax=Prosopis cineraria TaxID=364024 RepID=UPI00240F6B32|nr:DNA polymerase II subunit B3-1 [Prosopis cineraria]